MTGPPRTKAFLLEVKFRSNTSMQGDITWHEGNRTESFRSAMEMVNLILQACDEGGPGTEYKLRDWSGDAEHSGTQVDGCGVPAQVLCSVQGEPHRQSSQFWFFSNWVGRERRLQASVKA